jgi:[acyl-carrier-protein] S-malonyltransferase
MIDPNVAPFSRHGIEPSELTLEGGKALKKIAFLFPGQGSQKVGMGIDLARKFSWAKEIFDIADRVTGLPITRLCFEGPMEELTRTVNLQPAITAVNLACLAALRNAGVKPAVCLGHSLGEYSALCAAGVVSADDCLELVYKRGELMHREAMQHKGAMSAVVGLTIDRISDLVDTAAQHGVVAVANHNSAEQIVITGAPEPVKAVGELAVEKGARAIPLKVSGAWHSPLIRGAEDEFRAFLEGRSFHSPQCDVVHNATADKETDPERIKAVMVRQLCSPVRWYDSMVKMLDDQVDTFVEIGPGRVLTGLLRKIKPKDHGAAAYNVYDLKTLEKFLEARA